MSIALVTDSTSDIPEDLAEKFGITVVPNTLVIEGESLVDGVDITRAEFYERLPLMKSPPTTAAASSGTYQQLYDRLLQQGFTHILSIHVSTLLSAIYMAASIAAQAFGDRVQVIDSGSVTLGLGFQVLAAAEALSSRKGMSVDRVLSLLEDVRPRTRVIAMLDTLEYVRRSGRVSWAKARLGDMLHIKPFVEVQNGTVLSRGEARTYRKGMARLVEMLARLGPVQHLAILHTNAEEEAHRFLAEITPQLSNKPLIVNITTVIGAHVGPRGLGIAAVVK
jgi:DegV family protein with EDD domain